MASTVPLRVALSVVGRFHTFDLARQLYQRGNLAGVFSGYPRFKLRDVELPAGLVHSFPWVRGPYMAVAATGWFEHRQLGFFDYLCQTSLDRYAATLMPECDVFVGLSGAGLLTGRRMQRKGAKYVCDTGSSHIRSQNELLAQERERWRGGDESAHPRVIERAEAEYEQADLITVPSSFSARSFSKLGVPHSKLRVLPYGVDLESFYPDGSPDSNNFDVLFAGGACLRKGVPYLLQAFQKLQHPRKRLSFAGSFPNDLRAEMQRAGLWSEHIHLLGHLGRKALRRRMSRSHVLVLPSIEDGFGLVMAQAMACGCPVIASEHTGADDLFENGEAGYIVPIRRADLLAYSMQRLVDDPDTRHSMSIRAQALVKGLGGWQDYGERAFATYTELSGR